MKQWSDVKLLHFQDMVSYLNKYSSWLAVLSASPHELTQKYIHFSWEPKHSGVFNAIGTRSAECPYCNITNQKYLLPYKQMHPTKVWCSSFARKKISLLCMQSLHKSTGTYAAIEKVVLGVARKLDKLNHFLLVDTGANLKIVLPLQQDNLVSMNNKCFFTTSNQQVSLWLMKILICQFLTWFLCW